MEPMLCMHHTGKVEHDPEAHLPLIQVHGHRPCLERRLCGHLMRRDDKMCGAAEVAEIGIDKESRRWRRWRSRRRRWRWSG